MKVICDVLKLDFQDIVTTSSKLPACGGAEPPCIDGGCMEEGD